MKKIVMLLISATLLATSCTSDDVQSSAESLQATTIVLQPASTASSSTQSVESGESSSTTQPAVTSFGSDDWTTKKFELRAVATLANPIALATLPASEDLWVAERAGRVQRLTKTGDGFNVAGSSLDITSKITTEGEGGLLSIDFSLGNVY